MRRRSAEARLGLSARRALHRGHPPRCGHPTTAHQRVMPVCEAEGAAARLKVIDVIWMGEAPEF